MFELLSRWSLLVVLYYITAVNGIFFTSSVSTLSNNNSSKHYPKILYMMDDYNLVIWTEEISILNKPILARLSHNNMIIDPIHVLFDNLTEEITLNDAIVLSNNVFVISWKTIGSGYVDFTGRVINLTVNNSSSISFDTISVFESFYGPSPGQVSIHAEIMTRINDSSFATGYIHKFNHLNGTYSSKIIIDHYALNGNQLIRNTYNISSITTDTMLFDGLHQINDTTLMIVWGIKSSKSIYYDLRTSFFDFYEQLDIFSIYSLIASEISTSGVIGIASFNDSILMGWINHDTGIFSFSGSFISLNNTQIGSNFQLTNYNYSSPTIPLMTMYSPDIVIIGWRDSNDLYYRLLTSNTNKTGVNNIINDQLVRSGGVFGSDMYLGVNNNTFDILVSDQDKDIFRYYFTISPTIISTTATSSVTILSQNTSIKYNGVFILIVISIVLSIVLFILCLIPVIIGVYISRRQSLSLQSSNNMSYKDEYDDISIMPVRTDKSRTIIDEKYQLIDEINRDEAHVLEKQCGIHICFPPDKDIIPIISDGGFNGKIRLAFNMDNGMFLRINIIRDFRKIIRAQDGRDIQMKLNHPNIIKLIDCAIAEDSQKVSVLYMFMEPMMMDGEMLINLLHNDELSKDLIESADILLTTVFKHLIEGLVYMHRNHYFHSDIKPANLLIGIDGTIKITVTESACHSKSNLLTEPAGDNTRFSPEYMELANGVIRSVEGDKVDSWAAGLAMLEMSTGVFMFDEKTLGTIKRWSPDYYDSKLSYVDSNPSLFDDLTYKNLLKSLINLDPVMRTSTEEAIDLIYINYKYDPSTILPAFTTLQQTYSSFIERN